MSDRSNNTPPYGPDNPHPLSRMKTELVWEGKYDEYGNRRSVKLPASPLPLQRIEAIDEPRDRAKALVQTGLFDDAAFAQQAHRDDFRNMLIWGDNKLALAALLEQFQGKVDLIYIDPPFDVGADFTTQIHIGEDDLVIEKQQSIGEHRNMVLRFYKAAPLQTAPHPLLHGTRGGALVHVDQIDGIFTFDNLQAAAEAARAAGARELHCLAWEFEMELALKKQAVEAETGLNIRLKYIPREIMEPNRTEAQFFEAGYLEARAVWNAQATLAPEREHGSRSPKVDVELMRFVPSLAEAPEKEMAALRERAITSPFDFIDFWAVDFTWREGKPFEHHWQDFRTRKDRSLKTSTDTGWKYAEKGTHQICVKVIDVFGVDTATVVEVRV